MDQVVGFSEVQMKDGMSVEDKLKELEMLISKAKESRPNHWLRV